MSPVKKIEITAQNTSSSLDPDRYLSMYETQLILYDGAERMLQKMGLEPKSVNTDEIRKDYEAMLSHKALLEKTYKSAEKETKALQQKLDNIEHYLEPNKPVKENYSHQMQKQER